MDYRELNYLGLNEKEAKVYLAALELGKSSAQNIAKKANVNRATTYVVIEALIKRGLMSSSNENKKQFFHAEAPEKLSLLFREEAMAIQRKQEYLDKILPEMKSLRQSNNKPVVRFFEGKEGLRAIAEEFYISKHTEPVKLIYSYDLLREYLSDDELLQLRTRRQSLNVGAIAIVNDKYDRLKTDAEKIIIPDDEFPITNDIAIFGGNKVRIVVQKGDTKGIVIENEEIYKTFKTIFKLALIGAKSLNKKSPKK